MNSFAKSFFLLTLPALNLWSADAHWDIQYRHRQIDSALTINDIAFPSATRGIACGYLSDHKDDRERPVVVLTSDGGKTWSETPVKETGIALFFLDDSNGWMVTDRGMWFTNESGHSWTRLAKAPSGMLKVWFLTKTHGFAAGLEKRVLESNDGGETWKPLDVMKDVGGSTYMEFVDIAFTGNNGVISGSNVPPTRGGPDWMQPENAAKRQQVPRYAALLETTNGGKTWTKSEASIFGQATRMSLTSQGTGLGLLEFRDEFEYPSEVYSINMHGGASASSYKSKDVAITDVRLFDGSNLGIIAGYETSGRIHRSPIPGKLKVLTSDDREHWTEMEVDYRAVAHEAIIAGPDADHLWIATDTGTILKLVKP